MIGLLLASPFPAMLAGLRVLLNPFEFTIVGEAHSNDILLDLADSAAADVALYDLALDPEQQFEALSQLRKSIPLLRVIALSDTPTDAAIVRALQAGARGCLPKTASANQLADAVRQVLDGELVLPPSATTALLQQLGQPADAEALTPREVQVLQGVAVGQTNKSIALKLGISEHTVKFHLGSAMSKLGAASRAEAVATAIRRGWLSV